MGEFQKRVLEHKSSWQAPMCGGLGTMLPNSLHASEFRHKKLAPTKATAMHSLMMLYIAALQ